MSDDEVQYDDQAEHAPPEEEMALDNERALKALRAKQRFQVAAIDVVDTLLTTVDGQPAVPVTPVVARAVADLAYDYAGTWHHLYVCFETRALHPCEVKRCHCYHCTAHTHGLTAWGLAVVPEALAIDLLHFAQHAKRGTVAVSDVLLAGMVASLTAVELSIRPCRPAKVSWSASYLG
jgi:hypothetical protein